MKKLLLATLLLLGIVTTASAQLPKVMLKSIDGKSVSTDTLSNNGKPFIIDFFATWALQPRAHRHQRGVRGVAGRDGREGYRRVYRPGTEQQQGEAARRQPRLAV